ncbi:hypothetical protein [Micavibrio aeruginosavorus]|uniref:Uncharacterized protein n=1 Tax=Micavibrio aeruginosavorus EPB TaxID=349215 RepID=M4VV32_9BACT|nr:hypothetical protein [Micavibrio aeruginosavorus]AGH97049.1 hypothetical protein A11S_213 [Micavibrio aeruginosavorus EPB]
MVYGIGVAGFIGGFVLGLIALRYILKDRSKDDLLQDKSLRLYGAITWLLAALGGAVAMACYTHFVG